MIFKILRMILVVGFTMLSWVTFAESNTINTALDNKGTEAAPQIKIQPLTEKAELVKTNKPTKRLAEDFTANTINESTLNSELTIGQNLDSGVVVPSSEPVIAGAVTQPSDNNTPKVGKHAKANMDPASMILSLFMVIGLIVICALILKRFNLTQQGQSQFKIVNTLRLGTKERVMVLQVGSQQLLLGVTSQQITLLETLPEPLVNETMSNANLPKNLLSFLASRKNNS